MDAQLRAIADPTRRAILYRAWDKEVTAGDIAAGFDLTRPAVSQHLKTLAEAGLLTIRREGTKRLCKTDQREMQKLRKFLDGFWEGRLDTLKGAVETSARRRRDAAKTAKDKG
ncbi:MAG: metalloregulator ArsR/SmtB family transcription factor [Pseudomonadota bacterium]